MRKPTTITKATTMDLPEIPADAVEQAALKADASVSKKTAKQATVGKILADLDPEAARNFISTTLPFNEYEDTLLKAAVDKSGSKSIKGFIREALIERSLRILEGKPYA